MLSIVHWESRTGWDLVVRAFLQEFRADEDVALLLHTSPRGYAMHRSPYGPLRALETLAASLGFDLRKSAKISVVSTQLQASEMPSLYRAADALVHVAHSERCAPRRRPLAAPRRRA